MKVIKDNEFKNLIGPRLKIARSRIRYTQQDLSTKLEIIAIYIDRASISKIERQRRLVTDYELVALSDVLKVSINWLLELDS